MKVISFFVDMVMDEREHLDYRQRAPGFFVQRNDRKSAESAAIDKFGDENMRRLASAPWHAMGNCHALRIGPYSGQMGDTNDPIQIPTPQISDPTTTFDFPHERLCPHIAHKMQRLERVPPTH